MELQQTSGKQIKRGKQMVEEIEKNRVAELRLFYDFCKYNGCEEKTAEDCERCYFNKVYFRLAELEGKMRNGTLKEIPENAVVLTREEYDGKSIIVEMSGGHKLKLSVGKFGEMSKVLEEHTRKETAEKFAEMLKEMYDYDERLCDIADKICKELQGV